MGQKVVHFPTRAAESDNANIVTLNSTPLSEKIDQTLDTDHHRFSFFRLRRPAWLIRSVYEGIIDVEDGDGEARASEGLGRECSCIVTIANETLVRPGQHDNEWVSSSTLVAGWQDQLTLKGPSILVLPSDVLQIAQLK